MKINMQWFIIQWEWIKSFLSEPPDENGYIKGSEKRLLSAWVVIAFMSAYIRKVVIMNPADPLPDIPEIWAMLIFGILGLGTYLKIKQMKNGKKEIKKDE